jgi:hypothetical protein
MVSLNLSYFIIEVGFSMVGVNTFRAVSFTRCGKEKQVTTGCNDKEAGHLSAYQVTFHCLQRVYGQAY